MILNTVDSLSSFTLVPIALFMIMGEVMFQSRIAIDLMDTLDKWFGKLRGRLALMAVGGGVLFSANRQFHGLHCLAWLLTHPGDGKARL